MHEIPGTLASKVQPAAAAATTAPAATAEADESAIRAHLMRDKNVMDEALSEEQAAAMTASLKVLMEQQAQEWQQHLSASIDS